jgi:hypothetical protein
MTRQAFLDAYRARLVQSYPWAADPCRLANFMTSVELTVRGYATSWNHSGECVTAAWRDIGGRGKPTLKALRALIQEVSDE